MTEERYPENLAVYTDNHAGLALYRKFGFVAEGTHRAYALRDGVYVDAVCMARLHPRPPGSHEAAFGCARTTATLTRRVRIRMHPPSR